MLSENKLGSLGAYHVCQMLTENNFIRTIDLSGKIISGFSVMDFSFPQYSYVTN